MAFADNFASAAVGVLGLGDKLANQVAGETDDERKKRMDQLRQKQELGPAGSMAVTSLFGFGGGGRSGAGY